MEELEIKLYQLFKDDNWPDTKAREAVHTVKGLQKEANKELLTKTDFLDKMGDIQKQIGTSATDFHKQIADVQVKIIMWVVGIGATMATITISAMVIINKYL